MYNFKTGEVYICVKSTHEDVFKTGKLYPVIDSLCDIEEVYIESEKGMRYTDTYLNGYFHNEPNSKHHYEFKLVEIEEPKPDPKPVTIDVATLLELLVIKKYTATELVSYLKGYEKGVEQ